MNMVIHAQTYSFRARHLHAGEPHLGILCCVVRIDLLSWWLGFIDGLTAQAFHRCGMSDAQSLKLHHRAWLAHQPAAIWNSCI
jgi:hypothetical protein